MIAPGEALAVGEMRVLRRLPDASNTVLLVEVDTGGQPVRCVYKPAAGERPLWDFPGATLAMREVITAQVAEAIGWDLVPRTVWRTDGPLGPGMCQEFVITEPRPAVGMFAVADVPPEWVVVAQGRTDDGTVVLLAHEAGPDIQRVVALDILVNNADRKGGHLLRRADGGIAAIDHGVTWHAEPKLRTVLWGWAGEPLPPWLVQEVTTAAPILIGLLDALPGPDEGGLRPGEVIAARQRLDQLLADPVFPLPSPAWPALPWPPI